MAKDAYWFRHEVGASRTLRMLKIQHIYGHEGKGVYWDLVEVLREQDGYKYSSDESDLQLLCKLIGHNDFTRFYNIFKEFLKLGLLEDKKGYFFSPKLNDVMKVWESKRSNGSKGGRPTNKKPNKKLNKTESKANQNHNRIEENRIEENIGNKPELDEFLEYGKQLCIEAKRGYLSLEFSLKQKFLGWRDAGWKDGHGKPIKNWKTKLANTLPHLKEISQPQNLHPEQGY